jgi:hypothetical protein
MGVTLPGTGSNIAAADDANGEDPAGKVQLVRPPRGTTAPTRTRPDMSSSTSNQLVAAGAKRAIEITNESLSDELLAAWGATASQTLYDIVIPPGGTWRSRPEDPVTLQLNGILGDGGANAPANVSVYP